MSTVTTSTPAAVQELATRYGEAWNSHDLDRIMAFHAPETEFVLRVTGVPPATTSEQVREAFGFVLQAWPDQVLTAQRLEVKDDFWVCETLIEATLAVPWPMGEGRVAQPNGKKITFGIVDLVDLEQGLVRRKTTWIDSAAIEQGLSA